MLSSELSLPEVRVLYEIAQGPEPSATDLKENLRLDAGYLSRLLSGLQRRGLIERAASDTDARRNLLSLTRQGREAFAALDSASAQEVGELLGGLPESDQEQLVGAMDRIEGLLGSPASKNAFALREPRPGDLGWIVHRHGALYALEYGFDRTFEALVAEIVGCFVREFDPGRERCWVATQDGAVVGSVFVVRQSDSVAKLRLLYVEPRTRGMGLGRILVDECLQFARDHGYHRMTLWTNDCLTAACHIYRQAGFELVAEEPHSSFGQQLVGQTWERDL
jgi:DNA-binding MarR family transcriptional regulator/GNAT superfamily N-acetyltransferase